MFIKHFSRQFDDIQNKRVTLATGSILNVAGFLYCSKQKDLKNYTFSQKIKFINNYNILI